MLQKGSEVRSRTDYILGKDRYLFGNVSVWDSRHNSDHYMVLGCLTSASLTEHKRYLGGGLKPPTEPTREDKVFAALSCSSSRWDSHFHSYVLTVYVRLY